ncbi:MAG TPA: hypothetical protein VNQ56_01945 [Pseudolabrys sp.]|nr:hypothetical protein [Pseudolabrys sp.]
MTLARLLLPTLLLALLPVATPARAQAPAAQEPAAQEPPCMKEFTALRDETGKRAAAIRAASERKAPPQEACGLFKNMVSAEAKFVKFAVDNGPWCGIPPQIIKQMQDNHKQTLTIRTQVCKVAAQGPARPAGPSLSDALGTPTTSSSNVRTGHGGTFDTLTGTPLGGGR